VEKQPIARGAIRRELHGKARPFCGGTTYQLVLRTTGLADKSVLSARCRHCGHPKSLETDFTHILWI
jgi:hypothetical protein